MRAWTSGPEPGLDNIHITDQPRPEPSSGTLLVRVTHGALNFADLLMIDDNYQVRPPRPFTPGQELVGVVEKTGPGSTFKTGERIASKVLWGAFADYAIVREDMAMRISDNFGAATAAALPVSYTTAMVALIHCARLQPRETVLIHAAAGAVGIAAVEIAVAEGARVIATAGSMARLEPALERGAVAGVSYDEEGWYERVKKLTDGHGADVILDPVGGVIGENSLRCIARDGRLLIVGFASGKMPKLAANRLLLKRAAALGVYWNHDHDQAMLADTTARIEALMRKGAIRPVVTEGYGFEDLPRALGELLNRRVTGKAVIQIAPEELT